jgi:hypothetical protein
LDCRDLVVYGTNVSQNNACRYHKCLFKNEGYMFTKEKLEVKHKVSTNLIVKSENNLKLVQEFH